ncbi:hypothetical protein Tco_0081594 [Tanacetum coccineum]
MVNGERQLQALVDKKKVIITETSIRSDLNLEDAGVLRPLHGMNSVALWPLQSYAWPQTKNLTCPRIFLMIPITTQPSTSNPQKKQSRRKQTKNIEVPHTSDSTADVPNEEHVPIHSNDPLLSGEDRMKLTELMDMCTKLSERVLDLEHTKTAQA